MTVVNTKEFSSDPEKYWDIAMNEHVYIQHGDSMLIVTKANVRELDTTDSDKTSVDEEWINEFMEIPAEYRVNPFEISPSGDLFFADKRNIELLAKSHQ